MAYSASTAPNGALFVPVTLFSEDHKRNWKGTAMIDTGAQFTLIHPALVQHLGLKSRGEAENNTQLGVVRTHVYIVRASVEGLFDDFLSAREFLGAEHQFILGRQFLAGMALSANWTEGNFSIETAKGA
jgi:predicted aspartyl protease